MEVQLSLFVYDECMKKIIRKQNGGEKMKVIILLANGFEEVEALAQVDFLRRAGIEVDTVSIHETLEVIGQSKITIIADNLYTQINQDDYDAVILPGGKIGMLNLQDDTRVLELIKKYYERQKVIAAICAAPSILGKLNLLAGKSASAIQASKIIYVVQI